MNFDKIIPADHYSWLIVLKNIVIFNFPELMVLSTFTFFFFRVDIVVFRQLEHVIHTRISF